ncbi:sulfotransferase domain-containing protein [Acuticoccus kandeliae]|uniref:sulfotransferase domain-containing protein n=1 Tax=Acuticoccus kandeliae TaxID=2073160 RepID=UPI0013008A0F|nr:sulfotransferase domain-containing protein [Acuticoccus kandeliae]
MKTFIYCVGAQKAGTTWLHDQLRRHPRFAFPAHKELHVFNVRYCRELCGQFLDRRVLALLKPDMVDRAPGARRLEEVDEEIALIIRAFVYDEDYLRIFSPKRLGKYAFTGDFSTLYGLLPVEGMARMRAIVEEDGFDCRVIFLMRDPISRYYSALRMLDTTEATDKAFDRFEPSLERPFHRANGAYDEIIGRLEQVFAPEEILYGFYEDLFNDAFTRRLRDFLGLKHLPMHYGKRVNVSRDGSPLTEAMVEAAMRVYRPVYAFCADRFPETADLWPYARRALA